MDKIFEFLQKLLSFLGEEKAAQIINMIKDLLANLGIK